MSKYDSFPRNTKAAHLKTCAQSAREAAIRARQIEEAYTEHTPRQNTDELVQTYRTANDMGIDLSRRVAA